MKSRNIKNALLGIALALAAAYLYVGVVGLMLAGGRGFLILFSAVPFVALFYTSWVVIPLGAALGMLIPPVVYSKTRGMAALYGAALGAVAGLMAIVCLISAYSLRGGMGFFVYSITAYSALWVGAYAFYRAKGQSLYR